MKKKLLFLSLIIATFCSTARAMEPQAKKRKVETTTKTKKLKFFDIPCEVVVFEIFTYFKTEYLLETLMYVNKKMHDLCLHNFEKIGHLDINCITKRLFEYCYLDAYHLEKDGTPCKGLLNYTKKFKTIGFKFEQYDGDLPEKDKLPSPNEFLHKLKNKDNTLKLTKLHFLTCYSAGAIPSSLFENKYPQIKTLKIDFCESKTDNNKIKVITFGSFPKLKKLSFANYIAINSRPISSEQINSIPNTVETLKLFDSHTNIMKTLNKSKLFSKLSNLKRLHLGNSSYNEEDYETYKPKFFTSSNTLKTLKFTGLPIALFDFSLKHFPKLTSIFISNTRFKLYPPYNKYYEFPKKILKTAPKLKVLHLRGIIFKKSLRRDFNKKDFPSLKKIKVNNCINIPIKKLENQKINVTYDENNIITVNSIHKTRSGLF
jgi:hypothetical protein